ncbi:MULTISPECIES: hypothetical protein [Streptomyces]|uniref:hypothetical protein n=1 Tax=Streptomyces TaxID=1883 RepID=UPI0021C05E3E|nr:hypothetical protein [Streptomyces violarus]MCT9142746.1 hypothetical protein [Streptomyces violarus]
MIRPARRTTAVLVLSAALLLTSCGSGGGDESPSGKIDGADSGNGSAQAGPTASASPSDIDRPEIKLSKEFQANFENWTNSDPKLQAILDDGREQLRAKYAAVIEANPDSEAVAFYSSEATLTTARKWIKQFVDDGDSIIGEVRVFDPQVKINDTGSGALFYCVDERKASTKNRETDKVVKTPDKPESVLQYRTRLDRTTEGVWQTTSVTVVPGGCN